jgi:hypothetical protein
MNAVVVPASVPTLRGAVWFALVLAFAALAVPDCCLNGRHTFGAGMNTLGRICRSAS